MILILAAICLLLYWGFSALTDAFFAWAFPNNTGSLTVEYVAEELNTDIPPGILEESYYSYGGFPSDGESYMRLRFAPEEGQAFCETLSKNEDWQPTPLAEELVPLLGDGFINREKLRIPPVEQGFWFFYDRYNGTKTLPPEGRSFNYTLAVFDSDTYTLYYYEWNQ